MRADPSPSYDLAEACADYPAWSGPPRRTLILCTHPRAGSTLLAEAIYFAGGLGCPLEYYHDGPRRWFARRWQAPDFASYTAALHRARTDPSGVFSVKLFWSGLTDLVRERWGAPAPAPAAPCGDADYRLVARAVADAFPAPTFVFLIRRDEIAQAVSHYVAGSTARWREAAPGGPRPSVLPPYDFDRLVRLLAQVQIHNAHWHNFFRVNRLPHHVIGYEDLARDYHGTLRTFFSAIGRPDAPIRGPRLRKQADAASDDFAQRFLIDFHRRASGRSDHVGA